MAWIWDVQHSHTRRILCVPHTGLTCKKKTDQWNTAARCFDAHACTTVLERLSTPTHYLNLMIFQILLLHTRMHAQTTLNRHTAQSTHTHTYATAQSIDTHTYARSNNTYTQHAWNSLIIHPEKVVIHAQRLQGPSSGIAGLQTHTHNRDAVPLQDFGHTCTFVMQCHCRD